MKIFRKIRFDLMEKNKTGNYIKYAIGEIILVVLGILIALQINNWNQTKKDNDALKAHLGKIRSHTLTDLKMVDSFKVYRKNIGDVCKKARLSILDKTEDQNLHIFMASGGAFIDYYFRANTDGYEALKNSDYFGKINNSKLDSLLIQYHRIVDDISQNESSYNEYLNSQENVLSTQFDRTLILASAFMPPDSLQGRATSQEEYYKIFKEYTASIPYRNVINLAAFQFDWMIDQYTNLKEVGQEVIYEIDNFEIE